jgi:pre-peptidase
MDVAMNVKPLASALWLGLFLIVRASAAQSASGVPDHYLCYKSKLAPGEAKATPVSKLLSDRLESLVSFSVVKPTLLCNPAQSILNGVSAPPASPDVHEEGYEIKRPKGAPALVAGDQTMADEFGTLKVKVVAADTLLVRAGKIDLGSRPTRCKNASTCAAGEQCIDKVCINPAFPMPPPNDAPVDNFKCYKIAPATGAPKFRKIVGGLVQVVDQFGGPLRYDVLRPAHLCNPVNKENENPGAETHAGHLMCYQVKLSKSTPKQPAFAPHLAATSNTNFVDSRLDVLSPTELCVPARHLILSPIPPLGSLMYTGTDSHAVMSPGALESVNLQLNAGQTLTVVGTPTGAAPTLALTVDVFDPSGNIIAAATSAGAGQRVVLQTVPVATAGTYTLLLGGVAGSTGSYTLQTILNAAYVQSSDNINSIGTAYDLNAAFAGLGSTPFADRAGVVGTLSTTPGSVKQFESFFLSIGQSSTIAIRGSGSPASLTLFDGSGNVLATGNSSGADVDAAISNFVAPVSGTYYAEVTGAPGLPYGMVVTRGADFDLHGGDFNTAQPLAGTSVVLGAMATAGPGGDWYQFNVNAGDNLYLATTTPGGSSGNGLQFPNDLMPTLTLYDGNGNLVASATGNAADGRNDAIQWTALSSGGYRVQILAPATGSPGEYTIAVQGATGGP